MKKQKSRYNQLLETAAEFREIVTAARNRTMVIGWALCLVGVVYLGMRVQRQSVAFIGIADSRESVINFDFPVVVQRVHVITGQAVNRGDLLAEVQQPELDIKIHEVRAEIEKLQVELNVRKEMSELQTSRLSVARLGKKGAKRAVPAPAPQAEGELDPLATQIRGKQQELATLEGRERNLYVFAEVSGVVGSVNAKRGETVAPFSPILTVAAAAPTFVQGFVHESLHARAQIGEKVVVTSTVDPDKEVEGRIVSVGTRIVELPVRLVRVQSQKVWGREVTIEIPSENPLLLGEKVEVRPSLSFFSLPSAQAEPVAPKTANAVLPPTPGTVPMPIALPDKIKLRSSFEPSGAIYLRDLRKFAVISDDTDDKHAPFLFLLDPDGTVDGSLARIEGLDDVRDLESISQDDSGTIYLLGSQSANKKDRIKSRRNLLIKVQREGLRFTAQKAIELRPLLLEAILATKNAGIPTSLRESREDIEIESSLINDGHLLVGLKGPLDKGESLVLDLGDAAGIVARAKIDASKLGVAYRLTFPVKDQKVTRITDITKIGHLLAISTVSKEPNKTGRVWMMDMQSKKLSLINEFPNHAPEGLAYDSDNRSLMVLFDEKNNPPLYFKTTITETN